jgi:bis(5'-nucleosidyl)-tetraphosphatase
METEKSCGILLAPEMEEWSGGGKAVETCFLLLKSSKWGEWGPPKGHVEPGENETETALRELFEESGLHRVRFVPEFRHVLTYSIRVGGEPKKKEAVYFLALTKETDVRIGLEHTEYFWATIAEIETLIPHKDLRAAFAAAWECLARRKPPAEDGAAW